MTDYTMNVSEVESASSDLRTGAEQVDPGFTLFAILSPSRRFAASAAAPSGLPDALAAADDCRSLFAIKNRRIADALDTSVELTKLADQLIAE